MSNKAWIIFASVCVLVLGTLVVLSNNKKVDVNSVESNTVLAGSEASGMIGDNVYGNADSAAILVEYGDFQCPGCASIHPTIKTVSEKYKDQLAFVFRNFPITQIHPNALVAAAAAESAGKQGKYWEMHNALYENQKSWESASIKDRVNIFTNYASTLGLDAETFKTDVASEAVSQKISFDIALAKKIGVSSTPTFYLDGEELSNETWGDPTKFEAAIVAVLKKYNIALPETAKE